MNLKQNSSHRTDVNKMKGEVIFSGIPYLELDGQLRYSYLEFALTFPSYWFEPHGLIFLMVDGAVQEVESKGKANFAVLQCKQEGLSLD